MSAEDKWLNYFYFGGEMPPLVWETDDGVEL